VIANFGEMHTVQDTYVPQFKRQGVEWVDLYPDHRESTPVSLEEAEAEVRAYLAVEEDTPRRRVKPNGSVEFRVIRRVTQETVVIEHGKE
jgi:hypothetical protein